jgi:hypothetical protein
MMRAVYRHYKRIYRQNQPAPFNEISPLFDSFPLALSAEKKRTKKEKFSPRIFPPRLIPRPRLLKNLKMEKMKFQSSIVNKNGSSPLLYPGRRGGIIGEERTGL